MANSKIDNSNSYCTECGEAVNTKWKYCRACGEALSATEEPADYPISDETIAPMVKESCEPKPGSTDALAEDDTLKNDDLDVHPLHEQPLNTANTPKLAKLSEDLDRAEKPPRQAKLLLPRVWSTALIALLGMILIGMGAESALAVLMMVGIIFVILIVIGIVLFIAL